MKTARINGSLRVSRITAEQNLADLERIYSGLIVQAGRQAAAALVASTRVTLTAASDQPPNWQPPPEGVLFNAAALATRALKRLSKLHTRILRQSAQPTLSRAGIAWDVTHPLTQALLDAAGKRTGQLLTTGVQPVLTEIIAGAYSEGLPVKDTAELIREKIGEAARGQAQMLARTDLNSLSNGGSVMAATMVGATYKQWLTAEDDRVRETHADADGQTVPIDQPFDVGGEALDYPGDPGGSDEEVCNCRCTVIYVDASEAETASAGSRIPARGFAAAVTVTVAETDAAPSRWASDLAFEGAATEDGRYILPGALTWRDLPLSLGAMFDTPHADMVTAAPVVGRIDTMEKRPTNMDGGKLPIGTSAVYATGEFDTLGDTGSEVARMVGDETMRGVSIDLAVDDWCFRDPATGDLLEPEVMSEAEMERAMFGELQYAVRAGTIMAATVCPTPAFADARIALTASSDGQRMLRLWAPIAMASSGERILDEWPDAQTVEVSEQASSKVAGRDSAGPATDGDAPKAPSLHQSVSNAARSFRGGAGANWSAHPANGSVNSDKTENETTHSPARSESDSTAATRSPRRNGKTLRADVSSPTRANTERIQESRSPGTKSRRSWNGKVINAPSAETASPTNPGEGQSRTLTLTTEQEAIRSEDGSAAHVIGALAASATTQKHSGQRQTTFNVPLTPPPSWFYRQEADHPTPLTITDRGAVYGHVAAWNSCHTGRSGVCVTPPRSASGNAYFNCGEIRTADGERVACGQIFFHGEHAPMSMDGARALDHYAHTGLVAADVRAVDGVYGIWVSGSLRSTLTPEQVREFMAAKPSGDWRQMRPGGPLELTSILAVNDPGFPIPRSIVASADSDTGELISLFAAFEMQAA